MNNFVIAMTNRTGSEWLCHLLRRNGCDDPRERLHPEPGIFNQAARVKEAAPCGVKCSIGQWYLFVDALGKEWIDAAQYIWLKRHDIWRQAISQYVAKYTNIWHGSIGTNPDIEIPFQPDVIRRIAQSFVKQNWGWEQWFACNPVPVMKLYYEELVENTEPNLRRCIAHIGQLQPEDLVIDSRTGITAIPAAAKWAASLRDQYGEL